MLEEGPIAERNDLRVLRSDSDSTEDDQLEYHPGPSGPGDTGYVGKRVSRSDSPIDADLVTVHALATGGGEYAPITDAIRRRAVVHREADRLAIEHERPAAVGTAAATHLDSRVLGG